MAYPGPDALSVSRELSVWYRMNGMISVSRTSKEFETRYDYTATLHISNEIALMIAPPMSYSPILPLQHSSPLSFFLQTRRTLMPVVPAQELRHCGIESLCNRFSLFFLNFEHILWLYSVGHCCFR